MITIEKTETRRLRVNNSADSSNAYDISASVTIEDDTPQMLQNGCVRKRETSEGKKDAMYIQETLATFDKTFNSFNINFTGNPDKETRSDIFAAVQDFAEMALNQNTYIN